MKRKSVIKQNKKAKVDKKLQKTRTTDTGVELEFGGMF